MNFLKGLFDTSSTPASIAAARPNTKARGELHQIASAVIPALSKIQDVQGRSKELRVFGLKILAQGAKWPHVNWKQFALMHNESLIRDTSWEGGHIIDSIAFWRECIRLWIGGQGCFLPFDISKGDLQYVDEVLCDLQDFCKILPCTSDQLIDHQVLSKQVHILFETLKKKISI